VRHSDMIERNHSQPSKQSHGHSKILKDASEESTVLPSHYEHESEQSRVDKHRNELNYSEAHGARGRTSTKLLGFGLGRGWGEGKVIVTSTCPRLISLSGINFHWLAQLSSSRWSYASSPPKRC